MAKQTGPDFFTGRRGNLLGYRMAGKYYVRIISSLKAERVRKDPAFKRTMQYAGLLSKASRIASLVYRDLPEKEHGCYRRLTGLAMQLLKQGRTAEEALDELYRQFVPAAHSGEGISQDRPLVIPVSSGKPAAILRSGSVIILPDPFPDKLLERILSTSVQEEAKKESALDLPPPQFRVCRKLKKVPKYDTEPVP